MTICRYAGGNQAVKTGTLERTRMVRGQQLTAFVSYVNKPTWQVITEPALYNCPVDQGSLDVLRFVYPSGPGVSVTVDLGGCSFVTNGSRTISGHEIGVRLGSWVGKDKTP